MVDSESLERHLLSSSVRHIHMPLLRERKTDRITYQESALLASRQNRKATPLTKELIQHILLVDDDSAVRKCIRLFLESQGYRCTEADNGVTALEELARHRYSLIITDNQMPTLDGISFLEEHYKEHVHQPTPAIIVTGFLSDSLQSRADHIGVTSVFQKPYSFDDLSNAINNLI